MVSREPTWAKKALRTLGKEGPKDRLEMVSKEPTWAKKEVARIDERWFQESQLGQRRSQG